MFIAHYPNPSFRLSIYTVLALWIFFLQTHSAWPRDILPHAVVMELSDGSVPKISEQILLHKLRNELAHSFDLSKQSAFEIALQKLESSAEKSYCLQLKCIQEVRAAFPQTSLFLLKSQPEYQEFD